MSELTPRALLAGCVLGAVFTATNIYVGLKVGISDAGVIAAAVLAFAGFAAIRRPLSPLENNLSATCSGAAATMAATAGLLGPMAALSMTGHAYSAWTIGVIGVALAVFGVLIAIPLREPLVVQAKLAFPAGTATAEVIRSMAATGDTARPHAGALVGGASLAAIVVWLREGVPALIPASLDLPGRIGRVLSAHTFSLAVNPLLVAIGALIGFQGAASILGGAVVAWGVLATALEDAGIIASSSYQDARGWLLWPGVALVVSSAITSLALQAPVLVRNMRGLSAASRASSRRVLAALGVTAVVVAILVWQLLGVPVAIAVGTVLVTPVLAIACVRTQGETGIPPVGPIGGLVQVVVGPMVPGQPAIPLGGGMVVYGSANQTMQLMSSFKAGHLLGSSTRALIIAQLLGCAVGVVAAVLTYDVLTSAYQLGSATLPAPAPVSWKATAEAFTSGAAAMPRLAPLATGIAAAFGILVTLLARTRAGRWLPSPASVGVGFILPGSYSLTIFAGGATMAILQRRWPVPIATYGAVVAGGVIAGEAVLGVVIAVLKVTGTL